MSIPVPPRKGEKNKERKKLFDHRHVRKRRRSGEERDHLG
jgi:hypothetical protein